MATKAPPGLKSHGKRLWSAVTRDYDLRADELVMLESACRTWDELHIIEEGLVDADALIAGSKGQDRAHPLLNEARQHRLTLSRLLAQLHVEGAAAQSGRERSDAGRKLVRLRWSRETA